MDTNMEEDFQAPDMEHEVMNVSVEPRITNRAQGGVRTDKTRFIRPVERQRMRPWLIDHLDQNDIPGLVWQERSEMIFRISWKHAANQCFNMQKDTNLFERWAIHTGRHQDSDHKRWKANFRCALNSLPDVTEMKEQGVKKGNNAFKVYRFLDEKEAKLSKDGKPRKKKETTEYKEENPLVKFKEGYVMSYDSGEGTSSEGGGASGSSIPDLHQLVPSGVDMLLEADSKDSVQPVVGGMDNLQEILAAATASLAAGGDAVALEKISIEQLSRLGEVSKMKLDIRQSDRKRRKKEVSGILNVFLCNWCEKVFPTKVDLFQHFLIVHQDKLLSGEEYGARKHTQPTEKLQQEIEDLEKKVLGFTQESYQNESEEVIEDGQVVDLSSNNSMTSQEIYIEDQVLDLSVAGALAKQTQALFPEVALDLSMSTSKQKAVPKSTAPKVVQKRRRSNATDGDYTNKFGNYGLTGEPRTKRQLSLLLKRKEEEEEKARKQAEAQHSMEDLVHAEILISLKSGSKEENETESGELENGVEKDSAETQDHKVSELEQEENLSKEMNAQGVKTEPVEHEASSNDHKEIIEEEVASLDNVVYLELNDGSKVAVSKPVEIPLAESEKNDEDKVKSNNGIPILVESLENAEKDKVVLSEQEGSSAKPYRCALCPQRFEDPTELLTHVSIHKTEYKCSVCMKVMTGKDVYLRHIESHLSAGKHGQICEVCNVHFSTVEELQKHVISHESGSKLYKCGNCGKIYQRVKESINCEICLQTKVKVEQVESKGSEFGKKGAVEDTDKMKVGVSQSVKNVNEKGAAEASEAGKLVIESQTKVDLKEKILNTGQKNLKGEPVITPVAGSENLTGIINTVVADKNTADPDKPDSLSRKCSKQESFELQMVSFGDNCEVPPRAVKNDMVDGEDSEKMIEDTVKEVQVYSKEGTFLEKIDKKDIKLESMTEKTSDDVNFTLLKEDSRKDEKVVSGVVEGDDMETSKTSKRLRRARIEKKQKCSKCEEVFSREEYVNKHMESHEETIEDKIRKNVFHCGICDIKLHINDVEFHLQTHKTSKPGKSSIEEINEEKCTCVICKEIFPAKRLYTHLKTHSIYDLSKSQNVMPFKCNLCSCTFANFAELKLHVKTHLGPRISVESARAVLKTEKMDLAKTKVEDKKARGKKRKGSDEKRITGKRPKGKKLKTNSKMLEGKEKSETIKNEDKAKEAPTITAALNSGPKYRLTPLTDYQNTKSFTSQPCQFKQKGIQKVGQLVQLEKGPVIVLKNGEVLVKEEDEKVKVINRKQKDQLENVPSKKCQSTNENMSKFNVLCGEKLVHKSDDEDKEVSNNFGANNQNVKDQQAQGIKQKSSESVNVISSGKGSSVQDKNNAGTNANPATLHRLQQKILLVKDGAVKVATPVLSNLTVASVSSHQDLSKRRPLTCQTTSGVAKQAVLTSGNTSPTVFTIKPSVMQGASTGGVQTMKGIARSSAVPGPSLQVEKVSLNQETDDQAALVDVQSSSNKEVVNSSAISTTSQQGLVMSSSSSLPANVSSQIPIGFQLSTAISQLPISALANRVLKMHASGANTVTVSSSASLMSGSLTSLVSGSIPISLVGSLQNQSVVLTRVTSGIPIMACNSKQTVTGVSTINTAPSNIPSSSTLQQQQLQLNMLKTMIGRVSQPSTVNKQTFSPVLISQGGMQQAVPSTIKFPFSNIIYAPQTSIESQTTGTADSSTTKPPSYQLVWLPIGQQTPSEPTNKSASVTEAVSKIQTAKRHFDKSLCLENTVLGAKLRASNTQAFNHIRTVTSNITTPQSEKVLTSPQITTPSKLVKSGSDKALSKEKSSSGINVSSNCTTVTSSDHRSLVSGKPAFQILAGKSDSGLCIACAICKQSLSTIEQMSSHVCKISFVSPQMKKPMPSATEKKFETSEDSKSKDMNKISTLKVVNTLSTQIPLTLSTLPTATGTLVTTVSSAKFCNFSSLDSGVAASVKDQQKQLIIAKNISGINSEALATSVEGVGSAKVIPTLSTEQVMKHAKEVVTSSELKSERKAPCEAEGIIDTKPTSEIKVNLPMNDCTSVDTHDTSEDVISTKVLLQKASSVDQNLFGETSPEEAHLITLYPCRICNKTFTSENLRKHAKMHVTDADKTEIGVLHYEDTEAENYLQEEMANKKMRKPIETSRKDDIYLCCFCSLTCNHETALSQHYKTSHPNMSDYLCPADSCAQIFFDVQNCDKHYALKHQHECRFCLQRYRTYVEFQAHIEQHYKKRTLRYFTCIKCRAHFVNKTAFNKHCRSSMSSRCPKSYLEKCINCQECQCCSINFTSKECLKLHFKRKFYHGIVFRCCVCREAIGTEADILGHMSSHFPTSDDKQVCFCHTCCIIFPYQSVLSHHLTAADHIRAEALHQRLLDKYSLLVKDDKSRISQESNGQRSENGQQNEKQSEDEKIRSESELKGNCEFHDGGTSQVQLKCDLCDVCFKTSFILKQHKVIHHLSAKPGVKRSMNYSGWSYIQNYYRCRSRKSIICEFCGKRFFHIYDLRTHINVYHDEKPLLACKNPDCVMNFNSIYEYDVHVCKSLSKGKDIADASCLIVDSGQPTLNSLKEYLLQYYVEDCKELLDTVASTIENVQEHLGDHFSCQYCDKSFHSCEQLKFHIVNLHAEILAQCVDCMEYFFHQSSLLEHRRECAVKGFSDEDFHTKKKLLGCSVCLYSFLYIFGLAKYLRDLKFLSEKYKSSGSKCFSRKGVFDLKYEGECGIEEKSTVPFNNSRKFFCINCKNEYCNAEDFFICMQSRLTTERNRENEEVNRADSEDDAICTNVNDDDGSVSLFRKSLIDLKNVFFCNECESIVCYQNGGICSACLNHPCTGNNTLINEESIC